MASSVLQPEPSYTYEQLHSENHLRVLLLYPAHDNSDALEIDLVSHDRSEILKYPEENSYEAVSYVWGPVNLTHTIKCRSSGSYLKITVAVDSLLRNLRKRLYIGRLWVDALCINQKDDAEKSVQVQMMGHTYREAEKVHIWLGEIDGASRAFALLRAAALLRTNNPETVNFSSIFDNVDEDLNMVALVLESAWFQRRWVIQEAALSCQATVRNGPHRISWKSFTQGLEALVDASMGVDLSGVQDQTGTFRNAVKFVAAIRRTPSSIFRLLLDFDHAQCLDPRDRLFALYGLATDISPVWGKSQMDLVPKIDYSQDFVHAYQSLATAAVNNDRLGNVMIQLYVFGSVSEIDPTYPSWVPDWSHTRSALPLYFDEFATSKSTMSYTVESSSAIEHFGCTGLTISCEDWCIGYPVACISDDWPPDLSLNDTSSSLSRWINTVMDHIAASDQSYSTLLLKMQFNTA